MIKLDLKEKWSMLSNSADKKDFTPCTNHLPVDCTFLKSFLLATTLFRTIRRKEKKLISNDLIR